MRYKSHLFVVDHPSLFENPFQKSPAKSAHLPAEESKPECQIRSERYSLLDKKIVGVFRLHRHVNIIVYADGSIQKE